MPTLLTGSGARDAIAQTVFGLAHSQIAQPYGEIHIVSQALMHEITTIVIVAGEARLIL